MGRNGSVQMDATTIWLLFMATIVIHSLTFWFLEHCANVFRDFVVFSPTKGSGAATVEPTTVPSAPTMVVRTVSGVNAYYPHQGCGVPIRMHPNTTAHYQPLHDMLDVSVFR